METEKETLSMKLSTAEEKCSKTKLSLLAKERDWGKFMTEQTAETERLKNELKAQTCEVHNEHRESWTIFDIHIIPLWYNVHNRILMLACF